MKDVVHACRATWRALGVAPVIADEMAGELQTDLGAAAEAGVEPLDYVGGDAAAFAADWAQGRGVIRPRPRLASTVTAALLGAVPGAGFALFVAYGMSSPAMKDIVGFDLGDHTFVILALYAAGALVACGGAVVLVGGWLSWHDDLAVRQTVRRLSTAVPLGGVPAVGLAMTVGASRNFSTSGTVIGAELLVGTLVLAAVVAVARRSTVRSFGAADAPGDTGDHVRVGTGWAN